MEAVMHRALSGALLAWSVGAGAAQTYAEPSDCPMVQAPAPFSAKGEPADDAPNPGNRGIVPAGFVALANGIAIVHGIDVSKWQPSANFIRVVACGGKFAYVRLSAGRNPDNELEYRSHWANARSVGLLVGPYHNLTLLDPNRGFASLSEPEQQIVMQQNIAAASSLSDLADHMMHRV
jgi:GH25 family lysozyme M1 (1,4-beta-N-acetylmuramidase)